MKRWKFWCLLAAAVVAMSLYLVWPRFAGDPEAEVARLFPLLEVAPGDTVADVGAGGGRLTLPAARWVGSGGSVYASEIEAEKRLKIRAAVSEAGLENVAVVEARMDRTNLPDLCCDAIFLSKVYHHLTEPEAFARDLHRSVKPGGRVAVIDFASRWFLPRPKGVPASREGHGVKQDAVVEEMTAAGFQLVSRTDDWPGRNYCLVFERGAE